MLARPQLIALVTFPGVLLHEWAHKKACNLTGARVYRTVYLSLKGVLSTQQKPLGYVIHEEPGRFSQALLISLAPLIVNSAIALLSASLASRLGQMGPGQLLFYWLAFSAGLYAFPSNQDARNMLERSGSSNIKRRLIERFLSYSYYWLVRSANGSRRWWGDFAYSVALVYFGARL